MRAISNIRAVLFDMDGTLIDSELHTEPAIVDVCRELGFSDPQFDYPSFWGTTWVLVADAIIAAYPTLAEVPDLADRLHRRYHDLCRQQPPPAIPGASDLIGRLSELVPVAIVSNAYRESIEQTIGQLNLADDIHCYFGAEDVTAAKPAPDGFLHAAGALGADPARCLVFEDSIAGLMAGRAAGMRVGAILHRSNDPDGAQAIADIAIRNYTELADDFAERVCHAG